MGVAVSTSTSGITLFCARVARCRTPKRCCSSTIASASRGSFTFSSSSACVPSTSAASPASSLASRARRSFAGVAAVRTASGTSAPAHRPVRVAKCWRARISVGAMNATWCPASIAWRAASSATTVLPLPTSPSSRRCIGCDARRSLTISSSARSWSAVSVKGSFARTAAASDPGPALERPRPSCWSARRRSSITLWSRNSSSNARRRRAPARCASSSGRWIWASDSPRPRSPCARRTSSGTGSGIRVAAASSAWRTALRIPRAVMPRVSAWTGTSRPTWSRSSTSPSTTSNIGFSMRPSSASSSPLTTTRAPCRNVRARNGWPKK